jgi:hypothetical protein
MLSVAYSVNIIEKVRKIPKDSKKINAGGC